MSKARQSIHLHRKNSFGSLSSVADSMHLHGLLKELSGSII